MIRSLIFLCLLGGFIYVGATVNLGKRTLFGHIANIWRSDEAKEMREDVSDTAGPMIEKAKRGAKAGWEEYQRNGEPEVRDAGPRRAPASPRDAGPSGDAGT